MPLHSPESDIARAAVQRDLHPAAAPTVAGRLTADSVEMVPLARLMAYLLRTGWHQSSTVDNLATIWHREDAQDAELILPSRAARDHDARWKDALRKLAQFEHRNLFVLLMDLHADQQEIERRWLVDASKIPEDLRNGSLFPESPLQLVQGYLTAPGAMPVVRIRKEKPAKGPARGWHTVKALARDASGAVLPGLHEPEHEIPLTMVGALLPVCLAQLEKNRYLGVQPEGLTVELDVFTSPSLAGLVIVEIEVPTMDYPLTVPNWFGREITGNKALSNLSMAFDPVKARAEVIALQAGQRC